MTDRLTKNMKIGLSRIVEANFNAMVAPNTGAGGVPPNTNNWTGAKTTGRGFPFPSKEKMDDRGKAGTGREFQTEQRSGYVNPPTMEIVEELNTDLSFMLARRAVGGPDTVGAPLEAALAYPHMVGMQDADGPAGRQLPSFDVVYSLGGADFVYGGCVVDTFQIEQTRSAVPQMTCGLVGSGLFYRIRDMIVANRPSVPRPAYQHYMLGAESSIEFTDDTGATKVLTDPEQRVLMFRATLNNNIDTGDTRMGDPRLDPTSTKKGWIRNRLLHGDRDVTAEMTLTLDDELEEWAIANDDVPLTMFKYISRGHYIRVGATTSALHQWQFEWRMPACYFRDPRFTDEGGTAAVGLTIFPVEPDASYGLVEIHCVNEIATAIV
jgi:hypothetical protein